MSDSPTPRTDALCTRIYNESTAYEVADPRFGSGHNWTDDEAYGAAIDLARTLERDLAARDAEVVRGTWTRELPAVSGWFWLRVLDARPSIVYLYRFAEDDIALIRINGKSMQHTELPQTAEWCGPLAQPKEPT
jgi:hypothetical protein